jgi:HPt (histidine-containing phosphotransfer) domain-containing protein
MSMAAPWVLPDELRQLAESDEGLVKEVLAVFLSDTADRIARLRAALERGDRVGVKHEAHAIKGSAGQVGAAEVSALCRDIEYQAVASDEASLRALVARLEPAFASVSRDMSA